MTSRLMAGVCVYTGSGPASAGTLLDNLTAQLRHKIREEENLITILPGRQKNCDGTVAVLSVFNLAAEPAQNQWKSDYRLLVPAAVIVDGGGGESLKKTIVELETMGASEAEPEQQSLALFMLAVIERKRGNRASFKDHLGRLLKRERLQPEALTIQASGRHISYLAVLVVKKKINFCIDISF